MARRDGLTPAQEAFATGLATGLTQAEAYRRAVPASAKWKDETIWSRASEMAADSKVQGRVDELLKKAADANEVTVERVVREMARIAFFDPRRLLNDDGKPKGLHELDDATAAAIAGLDVLEEFDGAGQDRVQVGVVKKYKIADKKGMLDTLARHLGMFERDNKQKSDPLAAVLAQMGASALPVTRTPADE